jgi:Mg-chelatase subunit ChlI
MSFSKHFQELFSQKKDYFSSILGQDQVKEQIKSALLTNRHMLIFGPPGVGKTTLAKQVSAMLPDAEITDANGKKKKVAGTERFVRVQGSPDLTAEDLIGDIDPIKALQFGPLSKEAFTPGKIFQANNGVLFFDEVNRCSEKLQNALLQALQEKIVSIGSYDVDMTANFIFIGTLNPQDSSTEKLSDAFMDRFDIIHMSYPQTQVMERQIVENYAQKLPVKTTDQVLEHIVEFVRILRDPTKLVKMPSVRATIGLYERAQALAFLRKHPTTTYDDVADVIVSVLAHRIELKPSLKYLKTPEEYIKEQFQAYAKAQQLPMSDEAASGEDKEYT